MTCPVSPNPVRFTSGFALADSPSGTGSRIARSTSIHEQVGIAPIASSAAGPQVVWATDRHREETPEPRRIRSATRIPSGSPSGPVFRLPRSAYLRDGYKVLPGSPNMRYLSPPSSRSPTRLGPAFRPDL